MTNNFRRRLAEHGVEVPTLDAVPGDTSGIPLVGFLSAGEEAVSWWRRLRAISETSGLWPLLIEPDLAYRSWPDPVDAGGPEERLERAAAVDAFAVLNPGGMTLDSLDEQQRQQMLDESKDDPVRIDRFNLPFSRDGGPQPTTVALVAAEYGWQLPAMLGFGGWNECPPAAVHSAVLRYWGERYGSELVCLSSSSVEFAVARPPRTRLDAVAFAWEYADYCADSVDAIYQADDVAGLAGSLIDAEIVLAWWD